MKRGMLEPDHTPARVTRLPVGHGIATGFTGGGLNGSRNRPPVNFPSAQQADLARGGAGPKTLAPVPHAPRATQAQVTRSTYGQGPGASQVHSTWQVPAPNWGSKEPRLKWGRFIKNRERQRIDYLPFRADLRPADSTPQVMRVVRPALDQPGYNLRAVTSDQVQQLAAARTAARLKAAKANGR